MSKLNIDAFNTLEELSYYDMDDNDVVSTVDAVFCMKNLVKEISQAAEKLENKEQILELLKQIK